MPPRVHRRGRLGRSLWLVLVCGLLVVWIAGVWISIRIPIRDDLSVICGCGAIGVLGGPGTGKWNLHADFPRPVDEFVWWLDRGDIYGVGWIVVPLWWLILLCAAPAAYFWWRARPTAHCCASCGYNLAGLRDDVCPECGAVVDSR